jgi:hypothetical protein
MTTGAPAARRFPWHHSAAPISIGIALLLGACTTQETAIESPDAWVESAGPESDGGAGETSTAEEGGLADAAPRELVWASFYSPNLNQITPEHLAALDRSPYDGFTFFVAGAFASAAPTFPEVADAASLVASLTHKHVWPWIFWNRVIGEPPANSSCESNCPATSPCKDFAGIDLYDRHGALTAFYDTLHTALTFARETRSPGIFLDVENYSNYCMTDLTQVAAQIGEAAAAVRAQLGVIGARIADIVATDDPTATVVMTFVPDPSDPTRTETLLAKAILDQARSRGYVFRLVEGGEASVGYLRTSLQDLETALGQQQASFAAWRAAYANFALSGTLAPYTEVTRTTGFIQAWYQADKSQIQVKSTGDFYPLFVRLFQERPEILWLFGSTDAPYDEYDADAATVFHSAIGAAR